MARVKPVSPYVKDAARLLGEQIRLARRSRGWTQQDLADRAGITVPTLRRIERGDLGVALGTAFEVAALSGVQLFHGDRERLTMDLDRTVARSALLPGRVRARREPVRDDF
jgi:transcriptional regulator with XRE-family HTH domain